MCETREQQDKLDKLLVACVMKNKHLAALGVYFHNSGHSEFNYHLSSRTAVQFYLGNRIDKLNMKRWVHVQETETSQDANNADQKVKWFLKVHKTYRLLWEACFNFLFSQVFIQVPIL